MRTLTIALLQLALPGPDLAANLAEGEAACRRARLLGADIALFPEMWSNGYGTLLPEEAADEDLYRHPDLWDDNDADAPAGTAPAPSADAVWAGEPIDRDSPFVSRFRALAAELGMAIAVTYLERWPGAPRNTVTLIDRHGRDALTYAKVHTCAFGLPEAVLTPGDGFEVGLLDTAAGEVAVGAMICYDREFPESARALMLAGAEVILTPNACEMEVNRLAQFRSRAGENMVAVAMANYAGPGWGHSVAYDGIAYASGRSRDMLVVEAGEAAGVYPAVFDLDALRDHRRREAWGDAFRRPAAYGPLTGRSVHEPFIRVDRAGRPAPR
ncbi:carbon-nitrogen hydrolase family protein [Marinitenerispora sediminis]|uniref:Carbon-nitrogen hydrolase family protein n=1 Tax=Marinitenerispora sediminis TaxID=1931232 RepID=A0A368SYD7_9ACTN|nr:carbon-nitrogen hydrolase family protein [Marinitenerispora sediminis]RCV48208.1 carbon-nitrogen hydrolase family protein [Marinitenerispora sediminis]RCV48815.1 carbon-nitrogen hydrolase family protein [Marinitenerispora sediminis]RCV49400.1 carbon-nitrogen hydrolase family protein [Marinitenerispora sediminis]